MDLALSEEQELAVATLRRFVRKEIWLWEKRIDANALSLPEDAFAELSGKVRAMGLHRFTVPALPALPPDVQGHDLDLHTQVLLMEEVAQHRAGVFAPGYGLFGVDIPPPLLASLSEIMHSLMVGLLSYQKIPPPYLSAVLPEMLQFLMVGLL